MDGLDITSIAFDGKFIDITVNHREQLFLVRKKEEKTGEYYPVNILHYFEELDTCPLCGKDKQYPCGRFEDELESFYKTVMNHPLVRLRRLFKK